MLNGAPVPGQSESEALQGMTHFEPQLCFLSSSPTPDRLASIKAHQSILIAVSGGSDSTALMFMLRQWCAKNYPQAALAVATVDHGLRQGSLEEAQAVAASCQSMSLPHSILRWQHSADGPTGGGGNRPISSAEARSARYELLMDHAAKIGATCIMLGQTMDDQAETVFMRAMRGGGTRGLSAISRWGLHAFNGHNVAICRPMLDLRRADLQNWLRQFHVSWSDDPSNENLLAERVRVRTYLQGNSASTPDQTIPALARFAHLSARHRGWLSLQTATFIRQNVARSGGDEIRMSRPQNRGLHAPIVMDALLHLVRLVGRNTYRLPERKLEPLVDAWFEGNEMRANFGHALVNVTASEITIAREPARRRAPASLSRQLDATGVLDQFLPEVDWPVFEAIQAVVGGQINNPRST